MTLKFDEKNGQLNEIDGKYKLLPKTQYNLQNKNGKFAFDEKKSPFVLKKHQIRDIANGKELNMELTTEGWQLDVSVILFKDQPVFSRKVAWTRLGETPFATKVSRMSLAGLVIGKAKDCMIVHPGNWPPYEAGLVGKINRQTSRLSSSHMPGAVLYNEILRSGITVTMQTIKSDYEIATFSGKGSAEFQTLFNIRTTMKKGDRIESGEELISVVKGTPHDAYATLPKAWKLNGFKLKPRPAWTHGAVLYSAYVQGSAWSRTVDIGTFENFRKSVLPHLQKLGVGILWFNPFNQGRYGVYSYDIEPEVGTEADLKRLCEDAEKRGIRVLMDLIPHGPSTKTRLTDWRNNVRTDWKNLGLEIIKNNPEWISRKEDGSFKVWWGGYSMDYAHPGWQNEMAKLATHYVVNCGISGWRVDCARYSPDNERPTGGRIPSQSGTEGAVTMMKRIHESMNRQKKECILLGETRTTSHLSEMEFIYDTRMGGDVLPRLSMYFPETWVPQLKLFLDRDEASFPVEFSSGLMRQSENHDTATAIRRYGAGHRDALISLNFLLPGLPLINLGQEVGAGILISKLAEIRKRPEFLRGKSNFLNTGSSDPAVLTFSRILPEQFSSIAINFTGEKKLVELTLPQECRSSKLPFRELIDNAKAERNGGTLLFELPPYGIRVFAFSKENQPEKKKTEVKTSEKTAKYDLENSYLKVKFENGFPVLIVNNKNQTVLNKSGFVSDHFLIRDGKKFDYLKGITELKRSADKNRISFSGKFSNGIPFTASYTLNGKELIAEISAKSKDNSAFELNFGTDPEEWFVAMLEGALRDYHSPYHALGDEFRLVETDVWIRKITVTLLVQKSGVYWQADAQPLDPEAGQIAIRKGNSWSGIRFSQSDRALLKDIYLRENGTLADGMTLRLLPENGKIRFTLKADDKPQYPAGILKGKEWTLKTFSSRHLVNTPVYEARLYRNEGGDIKTLTHADGTQLFCNSRVYSDDGFFAAGRDPEFGKPLPCLGSSENNKESGMKIQTNPEMLQLSFGGELKRTGGHGVSAKPQTAYEIQYDFNGRNRIGVSASITPLPRPELTGGSVNWEVELPKSIAAVEVPTAQGMKNIPLKGLKKNKVLWKVSAEKLAANSQIIFLKKGNIPAWSFEKIETGNIRSLSLQVNAKGKPVFRFSFFDGDGCKEIQTRKFKCDIAVR